MIFLTSAPKTPINITNIINYGSQIDITNTKIDFNASLAHLDTETWKQKPNGKQFLT